jgi:hypothetical protein
VSQIALELICGPESLVLPALIRARRRTGTAAVSRSLRKRSVCLARNLASVFPP